VKIEACPIAEIDVSKPSYQSVDGYAPRLFLGAEEPLMGLDLATQGWRTMYAAEVVTHHHRPRCVCLRRAIAYGWLACACRGARLGATAARCYATSCGSHGRRGGTCGVTGAPIRSDEAPHVRRGVVHAGAGIQPVTTEDAD
jgi:hypothetical protein